MRILFLNYYQGLYKRGAEVFIEEIKKRLSEDFVVEVLSENKPLPKRWPVLWRLFIDPQGLLILFFTLKSVRRIIKFKPDVIVPTNGGWQPALIKLYCAFCGKRMVIIGHSGIGWDDINNLWCFPNCFVALSEKAKTWAERINPFVKVEKIYNGIDLKEFSPKGETAKINLERPIFLSVGSLQEQKKHMLTIKAVSLLRHGSLLILGDGEDKDKLLSLGLKLLGVVIPKEFRFIGKNKRPGKC